MSLLYLYCSGLNVRQPSTHLKNYYILLSGLFVWFYERNLSAWYGEINSICSLKFNLCCCVATFLKHVLSLQMLA